MLKELPKVGDLVKYKGGQEELTNDLTVGRVYEITEHVENADGISLAIFLDDTGFYWSIGESSRDFECWELAWDADRPVTGELTLTPSTVAAQLVNGATVTGFPSDVAAVIRNLEQAEFRAEIREEKEFVPGDIVMWGIDLAEVVKLSEGIHTEVKIGPNVFIAESDNLTLVATAETRIDKEEF